MRSLIGSAQYVEVQIFRNTGLLRIRISNAISAENDSSKSNQIGGDICQCMQPLYLKFKIVASKLSVLAAGSQRLAT